MENEPNLTHFSILCGIELDPVYVVTWGHMGSLAGIFVMLLFVQVDLSVGLNIHVRPFKN